MTMGKPVLLSGVTYPLTSLMLFGGLGGFIGALIILGFKRGSQKE